MILYQFRHGLDKEDVEMFKLALKRLKEENDELVSDVPWAYYPSDILFVMIMCCVYEEFESWKYLQLITVASL